MLALKPYLQQQRLSQADLARSIGISSAAMTNLLNDGNYPVKKSKEDLNQEIEKALMAKGVKCSPELFERVAPSGLQNTGGDSIATNTEATEINMLLAKQTLTQAARRHFKLVANPFSECSMRTQDDVFRTFDINVARESIWGVARFGGFLAIISESGGGKTTLLDDLMERIERENAQIVVIRPYVLGMEDNDRDGKTLKSSAIAEAIITTLSPLAKPRGSSEARFRQVHQLLEEGARAGNRYLLMIEEAHALPTKTLKHLKRFRELKKGFSPLLGILLLGQSELSLKLSESDPAVREVTQRIEIITLPPLDAELEEYVKFKFQRAGLRAESVFAADAYDAVRARLRITSNGNQRYFPGHKRGDSVSLLYPLAINNFLSYCINEAANLGVPIIDADTVKEV